MKIIEIEGKIQMMPRKWYHFYKKGWYKHETMFEKVWIRFKWNKDEN